MSTVHRILCKCSLEGDHYPPPNVDRSVKAYTSWDAERGTMNIETAIKTKEPRSPAVKEGDTLKIRSEFKRKYGGAPYYHIQEDSKGNYQ
uniref:Uncharacterized protein n=1 Tax=Balaenoptera musculus TaxID=9771 RepID=A0A8C0E1Q4_BALMU